jgi:hypothetical protein
MLSKALTTAAAGSTGGGEYQISRSLRFNSADSAYLSRTPASAGSRTTWTFSCWLKRSATSITSPEILGAATSGQDGLRFNGTTNRLQFFSYVSAPSNQADLITTQVFRDYSAWYNIVAVWDTENATSTDRVRIYINGSRVSDFDTEVYPGPSATSEINNNVLTQIGVTPTASNYLDGYLADIYFIDGAALTADSFGEVNEETGVWTPIKFSGTYGTNGFYLNFSDNSDVTAATLGADDSGNGNNWTPSGSPGFSVTAGAGNDSLVDSPMQYGTDTGAGGEVRGNYATMNPLVQTSNLSLSNGNLALSGSGVYSTSPATSGMSSGKWYWEFTCTTFSALSDTHYGIGTSAFNVYQNTWAGNTSAGWIYAGSNGFKYHNGSGLSYSTSFTSGDIIGVAFDADNGTLAFYKNGASQGTAYTGLTSGPYFPIATVGTSSVTNANFGQRPFAYTAPSGFKALVTTNLPEPTVVQGDDYFNTVLYTGNGTTQSITGVGFQPDLVWCKSRSNAYWHSWVDAVRGRAYTLFSNTTNAQFTSQSDKELTAFTSDGFNLGPDFNYSINSSGGTFVAWNWNAGGTTVTNNAGTIESQVRASTTAGFSIVTYTGTGANATVGHGLGVAPKMVIVKNRETAGNSWCTWHTNLTSGAYALFLDAANAESSIPTIWNSTIPTFTVFSVGTATGTNENTKNMVAYCFAEVEGFSKISSFTGNGLADGPFVYTGFRPAWVLFKAATSSGDWVIEDVARSPTNQMDARLFPSTLDEETSNGNGNIDYLSNGFKLRNSHYLMNTSAETYIYMAFAENPFKYSLAR